MKIQKMKEHARTSQERAIFDFRLFSLPEIVHFSLEGEIQPYQLSESKTEGLRCYSPQTGTTIYHMLNNNEPYLYGKEKTTMGKIKKLIKILIDQVSTRGDTPLTDSGFSWKI